MPDQGVRYVVTLQDVNVTSGLRSMDISATSAERSVASLNDTLRTMASAFGVGFGLHALVDFGKDAVQGAADYETAVKRIKFASEGFIDGAKNIAFINSEVDKFKIPLQDATDAYGKFLAMVKGSGLAGADIRKLHDELLLIGKVKGLGDGQLDASVMNLGKMLEAGTLDARHFRPLEQQLSGIGKYVADEMGITLNKLAILRNKGKLTGVDPSVLIRAIERQANDLQKFLPESTSTIQSQLNELNNSWVRFKNDLVFDNISELRTLFTTLKDGVGWLKDHEEQLISWGKTVIIIGKAWAEYKIAMAAVNVVQSTYAAFMEGYLAKTVTQTTAYGAQSVAINGVTAAIERMNFAANATNGNFITNAAGQTMSNTAGNRYILSQEAGVAAGESATAIAATTASTVLSVLSIAAVVAVIGKTAVDWYNDNYGNKRDTNNDGYYYDPITHMVKFKDHIDAVNKATLDYSASPSVGTSTGVKSDGLIGGNNNWHLRAKLPQGNWWDGKNNKISPQTDRVTGQRVVSYNITIKELNGQKIGTQEVIGSKGDTRKVAEELRDILVSITNDAQIRAGN